MWICCGKNVENYYILIVEGCKGEMADLDVTKGRKYGE
jgi:hypothetical protein